MSNIPFEPKDGDYVSLIERLGKTSIDEIKDEIAKTQKEHNHHAGQLNSDSIEKNISNKNQQRAPSSVNIPNPGQTVTPNNLDSLVQRILKILLFLGFVFVALITGYLAVVVEPEDEEIIFFPFIFFVVFVAVISSKLNKRKSKS
ncbi:hypothetical protein [Succinivibrio dextrinosolvens]|jgi:hypothetical protein|uniref:hypothetical protein n=1 Tax=Succinivibrio dextrinosolvens TaxID=83771 RepID=UPI00241DDF39|nr:hypothetical protein [Succinivibrio dextrinosolvens]MBE6422499.1 hypothetical protein [Succinivibrio dextrinosolvens]